MSYDVDVGVEFFHDLYEKLTSEHTAADYRADLEDLGFDVDRIIQDARRRVEEHRLARPPESKGGE